MPSARLSSFTETDTTPPPSTFIASAEQLPIIAWFREGDGHLVVEALAGTGKSTTIRHGIAEAPEQRILVAAFTKRIQEDMQERIDDPRVEVRTIASVGYRAIIESGMDRSWRKRDDVKPWAREQLLSSVATKGMPWGAQRLVGKLVTKARELTPFVTDVDTLVQLAVDFDILPMPNDGLSLQDIAGATLKALEVAVSDEPVSTGIDYADMLYLPLRLHLLTPRYDMVVVDEYQDMTVSQQQVIRAVCQPYGRIVVVGDKHQCIFGFRGADAASMDTIREDLQATVLPLSHTYRCPKAVVALAQRIVPAFRALDNAPDGIVDTVDTVQGVVLTAEPGDFVLSRTNAPLARVALSLLRRKVRARIQGRDIGKGLTALVQSLAKGDAAKSVPAFLSKLTTWEDKQCTRLINAKREDRCEAIRDQSNTLKALLVYEDGDGAASVAGLQARIDYLFADVAGTEPAEVVCSTVHKAKGLEANRVFILRSTFGLPVSCMNCRKRRCGCGNYVPDPDQVREENNLMYVALTRAMKHLTFCEERL